MARSPPRLTYPDRQWQGLQQSHFDISWEEKPFGYRSSASEHWGTEHRHFFIEDGKNQVSVEITCEFQK
jgi:hypothetical protein